jgi:hypothetical protein
LRESEISARLNAAIDRADLSMDRERMARYTVRLLVPEVKKLIAEEVRTARTQILQQKAER